MIGLARCSVLLLLAGCAQAPPSAAPQSALVGAWRSSVQFSDGMFAPFKDMEFLYVFNAGGTLTESSNYDGAPPVAPAYGVWRELAPDQFEAKYLFFITKPPATLQELTGGGGWLPAGHGVFTERIRLSADRQAFESTISFEAFDASGKPAAGGGTATGRGTRIAF